MTTRCGPNSALPQHSWMSARSLYAQVSALLEGATLTAAFREFLKLYGGSDLADNAQYWLGECFYDRKDYPAAVREFLLGERAASGSVRPGAAKSIVEGAFEGLDARTRRQVEALGLDVEDARVVVRREVSAEGRSRAWVNGSPTTAAVLSQLGALLVDLHGQHEAQSLLDDRGPRRETRVFTAAGARD